MGENTYSQWTPYDVTAEPLNFFARLNEGLRCNPPQDEDLALLGLFESLNIGPNKSFEPDKLDPATAAGLRRAAEIAPHMLAADFQARLGQVINGWQITTDLGSWQTPDTDQLDFLLRSAIAKEAQPGQNPAEALYPIAFSTPDGDPTHRLQPLPVAVRKRPAAAGQRVLVARALRRERIRNREPDPSNPDRHLRRATARPGWLGGDLCSARDPWTGRREQLASRT